MQKFNLISASRAALLFAALLTLSVACGKTESETEAPVVAAPVVVVEEASAESINDMMKRLGIDKRVRVEAGDKPPSNAKQVEFILMFFNSMVRGDAKTLSPLMSTSDQKVLANMVQSGQFKTATENIARVNVGWTTGSEPETLSVLGFFAVGDNFEAQLWAISSGANDEPLVMTALASPQKIEEKLQGNRTDDRIKQWLSMNKLELTEAKKPDEVIEIPQQDRSTLGETSSTPTPTQSTPSKP